MAEGATLNRIIVYYTGVNNANEVLETYRVLGSPEFIGYAVADQFLRVWKGPWTHMIPIDRVVRIDISTSTEEPLLG